MHEYICKNCGYRHFEKDMIDYMAQGTDYPNFAVNNVLSYMNPHMYEQQSGRCPECGSYYDKE